MEISPHKMTIAFFFLIFILVSAVYASGEEGTSTGEKRCYGHATTINPGDNTAHLSTDIWRKVLVLLPTKDYMNAAFFSKQFYRYVHDKNVVLAHFRQICRNKPLLGIRFNELERRFNSLWPRYEYHAPDEQFEALQTQAFDADFLEDVKILWFEVNIHHMWLNVSPNSFEDADQLLARYQAFVSGPENPNNLDKTPEYLNCFSSFKSLNLILKSYLVKKILTDQKGYAAYFLNDISIFLPRLCCLNLWMCSNDRWLPKEEEAFITNYPPRGVPQDSSVNENGFLEPTDLLGWKSTSADAYLFAPHPCGIWHHSPYCSLHNTHQVLLKAEDLRGQTIVADGFFRVDQYGEQPGVDSYEITFTRTRGFHLDYLQGSLDDPGYYLQGWPTLLGFTPYFMVREPL